MSFNFQFYPDPLNGWYALTTDNGFVGYGVQFTDPVTGTKGQLIVVPDGIMPIGAALTGEAEGFNPGRLRGFLNVTDGFARLQVDSFSLVPLAVTPPQPPSGPNPNANPLDEIMYVFNSTQPNLATKAGCGQFTEDVCEHLHVGMHPGWGHVKKTGSQNQWNGHAVDAIMLLVPSGQTQPGVYDIIFSTESPEAKPVFNYVGPPDNSLWYYPPASSASRR